MRQNPHVRICGGPGSATTLVYPTPRGRHRRPAHRTGPPPRATHHRISPPGNSSRPRTGGRRVAGHRPSVRRGPHPVHRGAARDHRLSRHPWLAPL